MNSFFRLLKIIRTFLAYRLYDFASFPVKVIGFFLSLVLLAPPKGSSLSKEKRLRLALEELGPVWIKLGQMLSMRRDLFGDALISELINLQDNVKPFNSKLAKAEIENALGKPIDFYFKDFEETPLASASTAQVYTATLKENDQNVVLKVIRPNALKKMSADIKLMRSLANILLFIAPQMANLKPKEVVRDYENTLLNELDLTIEARNAMRLKANFQDGNLLYIPTVYEKFTHQNLMVSERVYGISVGNIDYLKQKNTNLKLLAERGVTVFFTQVFRDSFFHADMHPGNVFVHPDNLSDPSWIGLDCAIVGTLNPEDKRYLAENFIAFFNSDYRQVAQLHIDSGWVPFDTDINEFENAIRLVCEPIFAKPLAEISFGLVLMNLFDTARKFNMEVQPQLILLQKTLLYVEGLGRELYPQLDLWATAKPFLEDWIKTQMGAKVFLQSVKEKAPFWGEQLPQIPELLFHALKKGHSLPSQLENMSAQHKKIEQQKQKSNFYLISSAMFAIIATLFWINLSHTPSYILGTLSAIFWIKAWIMTRNT